MSEPVEPLEVRIPLKREEISIDKTWVEAGRVRVMTRPVTEDAHVETELRQQSVRIERTTVEQYVDEMPQPRQEGDTWVIPIVEEVLVIERRLLLREEVRVSRDERLTTFQETIPLQHDELVIDRTPLDPADVQQG